MYQSTIQDLSPITQDPSIRCNDLRRAFRRFCRNQIDRILHTASGICHLAHFLQNSACTLPHSIRAINLTAQAAQAINRSQVNIARNAPTLANHGRPCPTATSCVNGENRRLRDLIKSAGGCQASGRIVKKFGRDRH